MAKYLFDIDKFDAIIMSRILLDATLPSDLPDEDVAKHEHELERAIQMLKEGGRFDKLFQYFMAVVDAESNPVISDPPPSKIITSPNG